MQRDPRKFLEDMRLACVHAQQFTQGRTWEQYRDSALLRAATERQLEIIGEALNRLRKDAPEIAERIDHHQRIIAFRNLLAHGYDLVDHTISWAIVQKHLPHLQAQVNALLGELDAAAGDNR